MVTLKEEVLSGEILDPKVKGSFEVMQYMKKMNEELYVVLISTTKK